MSVAQNRKPISGKDHERYLAMAKTLKREADFLDKCIIRDMVSRYAYSRSIDSMIEGAKTIRELLSIIERTDIDV